MQIGQYLKNLYMTLHIRWKDGGTEGRKNNVLLMYKYDYIYY